MREYCNAHTSPKPPQRKQIRARASAWRNRERTQGRSRSAQRVAEIHGPANAATQNLEAEKARLQAALDRANGERVRLAYDLANIKRQADCSMQ
jgi:hypothetical protein